MEIEVLNKKDQTLLSRIDVHFKITHPDERTPKRDVVREELADRLNVKKNNIVIDNMKAVFGKPETICFAKVYKSDADAKNIERKHILARNKIAIPESKKHKDEKKEQKKSE